jgi:N utilization substance protein B
VKAVSERCAAIDGLLRDVTENWRLERLGAIERSVLRVAAAELAMGDTPPKVVIQEAVHLTERFGSEASARFVNGVLDALARHMGRLT